MSDGVQILFHFNIITLSFRGMAHLIREAPKKCHGYTCITRLSPQDLTYFLSREMGDDSVAMRVQPLFCATHGRRIHALAGVATLNIMFGLANGD